MKLVRLSLSATTISGPLPTWLRKLPVIPFINLSHNNLSGSLTNLPSVEAHNDFEYPVLFLQNNRFNESIPWLLCKRAYLYYLDLYRNMLIGKFPYSLKNWQRLRVLSLCSNWLIGAIPSSIGQFPSLTWLDLRDNNFSGELPQEIWCLSQLRILDLGVNAFHEKITNWIGEKLKSLRFSLSRKITSWEDS
ncbi:putative non-specific serine/threonine protein kinase [Helianthus annuus]|nr:putative non-specific serine/threonine protein kinase [Helianthus annuus]